MKHLMYDALNAFVTAAALALGFLLVLGSAILLAEGACAETRGVIGPGVFIIQGQDGSTVSGRTYTQDDGPTIKLQIERIERPRNWNPEPDSCPRGVKVLRHGQWGC